MEAELCQARALPAGLRGSAAVVASQARWGHSTEASAERRAAPALTTYLMLQALLAHLYAHPHLLPPTAIYPASQHWPTGPSIASLSYSVHTCLPSVARQPAYHPSAHSLRKTSL